MGVRSRFVLVLGILTVTFSGIVAIFWNQEMQYVLPTPKPANYQSVEIGSTVALPNGVLGEGITHLHFYNPECPCSRFNLKHFKTLASKYADEASFIAIVPPPESSKKGYLQKLSRKLGKDIKVRIDTTGQLANELGVFSTPQAALVSSERVLAYRGNYNRSRYCTSPKTDFASIALKALLDQQPIPEFSPHAYVAYGCGIDALNSTTLSPTLHGITTTQ